MKITKIIYLSSKDITLFTNKTYGLKQEDIKAVKIMNLEGHQAALRWVISSNEYARFNKIEKIIWLLTDWG